MDIDNIEEIKKLDKQNILGSIETLSDQCLHAWDDTDKIEVPESYRSVNKVVMCGMGGSGLGARVIESVYADEIKVPLVRVNDYNLPNFVDSDTLVICSSYSGETEETISNINQAIDKGAKIMAIGGGNSLIKIAQENNFPYYQIDPKFNISNQPRMAIGYSIVGQLGLASKAGLINFTKDDLDKIVNVMKKVSSKINVNIPTVENESKKAATTMLSKVVFYASSSHLVGATHVINNQANENAKAFTTDFSIPELNHHLMEGLGNPDSSDAKFLGFFVSSNLYSERIQKRFDATEEVCKKQGAEVFEYKLNSETEIEQAFELIQFGAYTNFYLAMLYNQNPGPIPWVDYFKVRLGQPLGK